MCANPYSGQRQKTYLCVSTPYPNNNVGACMSNMAIKNTVNHCIPLRTTSNNASSSGKADISRNMARNSCMWPTIQAMQTLAIVQLASTAQMQPFPAGMASVNNPDVQHTATSWHVPNDVTTCSSSQHTAGNPAVSAVTGCNADGTAYWWPDWWHHGAPFTAHCWQPRTGCPPLLMGTLRWMAPRMAPLVARGWCWNDLVQSETWLSTSGTTGGTPLWLAPKSILPPSSHTPAGVRAKYQPKLVFLGRGTYGALELPLAT